MNDGTSRWRAIGATVRGDAHRRSGAPNQDSLAIVPGHGGEALVAVADGHGSEVSFRSDFGAAAATAVAVRTVRALAEDLRASDDRASMLSIAEREIPHRIVRDWVARVSEDLSERPFDDRELASVRASPRGDAMLALEENPLVAYGSTLLVAATFKGSLLLVQLGDGDIVTMFGHDPGEPVRPVRGDPRLHGNQTTSLCLPTAAQDFRLAVVDDETGPEPPTLVVVTSDGYVNSFVDDEAFLQAGPDILSHIRARDLDWVSEQLPGWLDDASRLGSGDDISMGLLVRSGSAEANAAAPRAGSTSRPDTPAASPPSGGRRTPATPGRNASSTLRTGAWLSIVIGAAVVGIVVGAIAFRATRPASSGPPGTPAIRTSAAPTNASPAWVWLGDGRLGSVRPSGIGRTITVQGLRNARVVDVAAGFGRIWVATAGGAVYAVDPDDPDGFTRIPLKDGGARPTQIVATRSSVVIITDDPRTWYAIDPAGLRVRRHGDRDGSA